MDSRKLISLVKEAFQNTFSKNAKKNKAYIEKTHKIKVKLEDVKKALLQFEEVQVLQKDPPDGGQHRSNGVNLDWYIDLIDLGSSGFSSGWLLTVLDFYSRFAFVVPIANKKASTINKAFKPLYNLFRPQLIHADDGSEWAIIKKTGNWKISKWKRTTAPIEAFNRTIIEKLRLLKKLNGRGWRQGIQNAVVAYNEERHSATKETPTDLLSGKKKSKYVPVIRTHNLKQGDWVRLRHIKKLFEKGARRVKLGERLQYVGRGDLPGTNQGRGYKLSDGSVRRYGEIVPVADVVREARSEDVAGPQEQRKKADKRQSKKRVKRRLNADGINPENAIEVNTVGRRRGGRVRKQRDTGFGVTDVDAFF
jgi:hypothetical protein